MSTTPPISTPRRSLQDKLIALRLANFIGRDVQLQAFRRNLDLPAESSQFRSIFTISGPAGAGKTWLLWKYRQIIEEKGGATAYLDEKVASVADAMGKIAAQLEKQGCRLAHLSAARAAEAPEGVEPPDLTPLLIQDLNAQAEWQHIAVMIDSYERTAPILDAWLRQLLSSDLDLTANLVFVIAGRQPLPAAGWAPLAKLVYSIHLDVFSAMDAHNYLIHQEIIGGDTGALIIGLSGGLPGMLADLTSVGSAGEPASSLTQAAILGRYAASLDDPVQSSLFLDAALARAVSMDACQALAPGQDAAALFTWLKALPCIQFLEGQYTYQPAVRRAILHYLREKEIPSAPENLVSEEKSRWTDQHTALGDCFEHALADLNLAEAECWKDPLAAGLAMEMVYHRLSAHPVSFLPTALGQFLAAVEVSPTEAMRCAQAILAAGSDGAQNGVASWGQQLAAGLSAFNEKRYPETLAMLARLAAFPGIPAAQLVFVHTWRGEIYLQQGQYNEAVASFTAAMDIDPGYFPALSRRGAALYQLQRFDEALADFNRGLAFKPQDDWSLAYRGDIYRWKQQHRRALNDFTLAVALNDKNVWALARLGEVYRQMGAYPRAVSTFGRVLALDPGDVRSLALRGEARRAGGQPATALADFDAALQRNPLDAWTLARRGEAHARLGQDSPALEDFNRALALLPQDAWARLHRGVLLLRHKRRGDALADFAIVLQADPENIDALLLRGQALAQLHHYNDALSDFDQASRLQPDNAMIYFERGRVHLAMRRYPSALLDFNRATPRLSTFSPLFICRGRVYAAQGTFDLALADLDHALALSPDSREARLSRLKLHLRHGHLSDAFADLARLIHLP